MPYQPATEQWPASWNYTQDFTDVVGQTYANRPVIGRDRDILGGVYYGLYPGEAIVVDPDKHPEYYLPVLDKVAARSRGPVCDGSDADKPGEVQRDLILGAVFDTVKEALPYSQEGVNDLLRQIAYESGQPAFVDGTKVELSTFIAKKAGVCRHQALLCGALLQVMKEQGYLRGRVSVDRNIAWSPNGEAGGHAWARYTNSAGGVYILDVAQNYIGPLENASAGHWNYFRPGEKKQAIAPVIGTMMGPRGVAAPVTSLQRRMS